MSAEDCAAVDLIIEIDFLCSDSNVVLCPSEAKEPFLFFVEGKFSSSDF